MTPSEYRAALMGDGGTKRIHSSPDRSRVHRWGDDDGHESDCPVSLGVPADCTCAGDREHAVADSEDADGDGPTTIDELRERVADVLGVSEASLADMDVDDLTALVDSAADHAEQQRENREHVAESGRGSNGYPAKGRDAWERRDGRSSPTADMRGAGGGPSTGSTTSSDDGDDDAPSYPAKGRDAWTEREHSGESGDKVASRRARVRSTSDSARREHTDTADDARERGSGNDLPGGRSPGRRARDRRAERREEIQRDRDR